MVPQSIRVLVLYRDTLVSLGMAATLRGQPDVELVSIEGPDSDLPSRLDADRVDVVVADYENGLVLMTGARAHECSRHGSSPTVLIVTQRESEREIRHALEHGVRGYLVLGCGVDELVHAVRAVHRGVRYVGAAAARRVADSVACELLTPREIDVLRLVVEGHGNKTIANRLGIAIGTVKTHLKAIFQKLEASTRTQVAAVAERRGLLAIPDDLPRQGIARGLRSARWTAQEPALEALT